MSLRFAFVTLLIAAVAFGACRREDDLTTDRSARLSFSTDTVRFDTVFTELASATLRYTIRNRNRERIRISSISLKRGAASQFRFTIDGITGPEIKDLEIRGEDSAFVFVEVTVDPLNQSSPLVIQDAMQFLTNGNLQEVVLEAWGQDAYYYRPTDFIQGFPPLSFLSDYDEYFPISTQMTLPNDKPHVIFGYLLVDSLIELTVPEGAQIHFYDGAGLWMYRGSTLKVQGSLDNEVVFQGFRLEPFYDDQPGQWDRIILNESPTDHEIDYAIIKNGFIGLSSEFLLLSGTPQIAANKLTLTNTIIQNMEGVGVLSRNFNITAENTVISNAANQLLAIQGGGTYDFRHCTFGNYWRFGTRSTETFFLSNNLPVSIDGNTVNAVGDLNMYFGNSIVYGTNQEELEIDSLASAAFDLVFDHCLIKTELQEEHPSWFQDCFFQEFPNQLDFAIFTDPTDFDFTLLPGSRPVDVGSPTITGMNSTDLAGNMRDGLPDLGAYEQQ